MNSTDTAGPPIDKMPSSQERPSTRMGFIRLSSAETADHGPSLDCRTMLSMELLEKPLDGGKRLFSQLRAAWIGPNGFNLKCR